ncbi:MAG: CPBP family intramembrane metalloprotease [Acidobacteriia bacterium]|nr:CPBP family intramembrane metalloprotease [Terriglobia bacterium]
MRERLTAGDLRFLFICLALLVLTVWFSATYFYKAFPEASIDFRVTRDEARLLAERFLSAQGHDLRGYREASRFSFDDSAKTFLERELGLEAANGLMGSHVRLWSWSHRWFRPQQKEEYRVDITPAGETAGFDHQIPEAAPRPSVTPEQARALAESFLRMKMGRDPGALEFVEASAVSRPARQDHVFTWKERNFEIREATYRMEVTVLGNEIGGYREYLKVPEAWLRGYDRLRSRNLAAQTIDTVLLVVLVVALLAIIVMRVRLHDVRWGRATVVGAAGAVLSFLASLNSQPLAEFAYPTTDSYGSFIARHIMQDLLIALSSGSLLFVLTAGAEPLYRQFFASKISLGNLFRPRGLRTKSFFKGAVLGLTLTGVFVAYQIVFYLLGRRMGAWSPADVPYDDLLNTRFPWLFVLFGGFLPAISEEFLFRMFAIPFLRKVVRATWAALILAGFIWGFGHAGYPQQPFYIRGVEVGIGGVALGMIMLRWGILPTLVWHYSVDALYTALLLMRSHNLYFVFSGALSAGIMVLPVLIAWVAYLRGGGFQPEAGLTNGDEGFAAPVAAEVSPPTEEVVLTDSRPMSTRRRLAAGAIVVVSLGSLLAPVQRFGDLPKFKLGASQAQSAADAFLRERGVDPAKFRIAVYPMNPADDHAVKYFLERRPVADVAGLWERYIPLHGWTARYYRPLDKEEIRAALDPETGRVVSFHHLLPEDRAGADLGAEDARKIASAFLMSRGVELSGLELKETTSERKKARRDYTLVWEASAGDPRNVEEARYRISVEVAGDQVAAMAPFWKLPESYVRERSRRNLLSNVLLFLRIVFIAGAVGLSLWLIVQRTRKRELRWGNIMRVAVPVAALGLLGAISDAPLALRNYDTAMPLETFRAVMIAGIVIGALGLFLGMACCAGLLFAVRPESLAALKPAHRRAVLADSLIALAVAAALATLLSQCEWFVIDRFHAQAVLSAGSPDIFGTISPAVSATAGAFESAIFELALLAFIGYAAGLLARRRWQTGVLALAGIAAFVPSQVHTAAEFALHYAILLATAGAIWLFVRGFAGGNALAYLLAVLTLGLGRRALMLLEQPYDGFRTQGWLVLVLLVMIVGWVVKPALSSARD